jgi:diguanylate cyclase
MESETGELKSKLITAKTHALRDALTDLPNRQAYDERLITEIARWQRYHTPLCLVVWDIDFFKNINDQFGHQMGDKVLVHIACQFSKNIRRSDFIARFGGEEFTMLLPHTNKHSAFKVAEKFRLLIEQSNLNVNDTLISITISCGITEFIKGDTHEIAFARADQALYRAKEQGRNQCCMS